MPAPIKTEWWPTDYLDEVSPPGRHCPNAWIVDVEQEQYLAGEDAHEPFCREEATHLIDGAIVHFSRCDTFAEIVLTLTADGYSLASAVPEGFEQCCILDGWQCDTLAGSVEEMVAFLREAGDEPGDYAAAFYTFTDAGPWRFDRASRSFVQVQS